MGSNVASAQEDTGPSQTTSQTSPPAEAIGVALGDPQRDTVLFDPHAVPVTHVAEPSQINPDMAGSTECLGHSSAMERVPQVAGQLAFAEPAACDPHAAKQFSDADRLAPAGQPPEPPATEHDPQTPGHLAFADPAPSMTTGGTHSQTERRSTIGSVASRRRSRRRTSFFDFFAQMGGQHADVVAESSDAESLVLSPTQQLHAQLGDLTAQAGYSEMFGVYLQADDYEHIPTRVVLKKFLCANDNNVAKAASQLRSSLLWRRQMRPLDLAKANFSRDKFEGLGFITGHNSTDGREVLINWNIYGACRDTEKTFGNVHEFMRYRIALMERCIQQMGICNAQHMFEGEDPYRMIQVHDFKGTKLLRMDPVTRTASMEAIRVFQANYPELLSKQFVVNVPIYMDVVVSAVRALVPGSTMRKFKTVRRGSGLAAALADDTLPSEYGGRAQTVQTGMTVQLVDFLTTCANE